MAGFEFPEGGVTPENWNETFERFKAYEESINAYDARARFLRGLPALIEEFDESRLQRLSPYDSPAIQRLLDSGADAADLSKALRYVASYTVFGVLVRLDEAHDYDLLLMSLTSA